MTCAHEFIGFPASVLCKKCLALKEPKWQSAVTLAVEGGIFLAFVIYMGAR